MAPQTPFSDITPSAAGIDVFPGAAYSEPSIKTTAVPLAYPPVTCGPNGSRTTAVTATATATGQATTSKATGTATGTVGPTSTSTSKPSGAGRKEGGLLLAVGAALAVALSL